MYTGHSTEALADKSSCLATGCCIPLMGRALRPHRALRPCIVFAARYYNFHFHHWHIVASACHRIQHYANNLRIFFRPDSTCSVFA